MTHLRSTKSGTIKVLSSGQTATIENMDLYVDGATGSDSTGDGSAGSPYATIARACEDVPEVIAHNVCILVDEASGHLYDCPALMQNTFKGKNGALSLVGVGSPTEEVSSFTLTGDSALGTEAGHQFDCAGAGWTDKEHSGFFLNPTTGAAAGKYIPILNNDSDSLWCPYRDPVPASGDDCRIVHPSTRVKVSDSTFLVGGADSYDSSWNHSRLGLFNMQLELSDAVSWIRMTGEIQISFCVFLVNDAAYDPISVSGANINRWPLLDTSAAGKSGLSGLEPAGFSKDQVGFTGRRETPGSGAFGILITEPRASANLYAGGYCALESEFAVFGNLHFYLCGFGRLGTGDLYGSIIHTLVDGMGSNDGITAYTGASLRISKTHVRDATMAFELGYGSHYIKDCSNDPTTADYGIICGAGGFVRIGDACANLSGTTNDIKFTAPDPDTNAAWPAAAGDQTTDGLGASVVRTG